jgi:hypothetical protein
MRATRPRLSSDKEALARYATPLPAEKIEQMPFCSDPATWRIIAPWPRRPILPDEESRLCRVIDQVAQFGAALRVPARVFADGRAPIPINAADPKGLARWAEGKATYVNR